MVNVASGGQGCYQTKQLLTKAIPAVTLHSTVVHSSCPPLRFFRAQQRVARANQGRRYCWCSSSRKSNRAIGPT